MEHQDYMEMAVIARRGADCRKRQVGAVLVPPSGSPIYVGHNGAPSTGATCMSGACYRCAHPEKYKAGEGYDRCICIHAEERCALAAGPFAQGATVYSTIQPCFQCSRQLLEAGVSTVYYIEPWELPDLGEREAYEQLQRGFSGGVHRLPPTGEAELAA